VIVNADKPTRIGSQQSLTQWADRILGIPSIQLKVQVRSRQLHIWCEGQECPDAATVMGRFSQAIRQQDALPEGISPIDQVYLYGRQTDPNDAEAEYPTDPDRLDWAVRFEVKPQDLRRREQSPPEPQQPEAHSPTLQEIAQQGNASAIARELNEIFSHLQVRIKVSIKSLEDCQSLKQEYRRLWVLCESSHIPDAVYLGEPIAHHLRNLHLQGFQDAVILGHVSGEPKPEWTLRVDLTPADEILAAWAHWGDVGAIAERLHQALTPYHLQVSAILKEATLHIFCTPQPESYAPEGILFPAQDEIANAIAPILQSIAPRGILGATLYGIDAPYEASFPEPAAPVWVTWLNLPASEHSQLATSTHTLAREGNLTALTFMLERLLNPHLQEKLLTGGTRVKIRRKDDLLHIMTEALSCPQQTEVVEPIAKFVRQLQLAGLSGVRVYGRRSGQKQPRWNYGVDFITRTAQIRDTMPEFAPLEIESGDLLLDRNGASDSLTDVPPIAATVPAPEVIRDSSNNLRNWLCRTLLLVPQAPVSRVGQKVQTALVWGTLGLFVTLAADWLLAQRFQPAPAQATATGASQSPSPKTTTPTPSIASTSPTAERETAASKGVFDSSGFTSTTSGSPAESGVEDATLDLEVDYPTFNSQQLDRQLALYQNYIERSGVPDVLIVGSSRSLRGIDPDTLEQALASEGYANVRIFNLGINGATAQVVNLVVRQILTPKQLPKLIIWADGARAFNSGRDDRTYQAIMLSAGYKNVLNGKRPITQPNETSKAVPQRSFFQLLTQHYQNIDDRLNQALASASATYNQRETLREQLVSALSTQDDQPQPEAKSQTASANPQEIYFANGFLAMSVRFNPKTYYRQYSRVTGDYDSDYQSFQLRGKQSIAFTSLVEFTRSQNINLVFVNLPLTSDYLDPVRMKHEQNFQEYMMLASQKFGFSFRNLGQLWPKQHPYFSDPSHLNRYGAEAVAERLAQDPMIPWLPGKPIESSQAQQPDLETRMN
jgi:hypothetical protein